VNSVSFGELQQLVSAHGYWVVALIVGLESMGLPLPGETILVLAAIYAATEPSFNVWVVIAVAAFGAIVGDNAGYWLGLRYGYALLLRYGERIGMFEARIKLGQYLFLKHGAKVVFLGRFVALLRTLAAFLAGVNRMPWLAFLIANASGGIIWAAVFGIGGYSFGKLDCRQDDGVFCTAGLSALEAAGAAEAGPVYRSHRQDSGRRHGPTEEAAAHGEADF
jgi:membrane protein DedA with SNARE-associated domain